MNDDDSPLRVKRFDNTELFIILKLSYYFKALIFESNILRIRN